MTLSDFIDANVEPILEDWQSFAEKALSAPDLDRVAARDHAKGILEAIAADLRQAQTPAEQSAKSKDRASRSALRSEAWRHGLARQAIGFSLNQEVSEFRALRASIVRLWTDSLAVAEKRGSDIFDQLLRFDEAMDQALAESIEAFAAELERRAHLFDTLLLASPDLHFILDPEGRFLYANQALPCVYDVSPSAMVGRTLFDLGSPVASQFQPYFESIMTTRQQARGDLTYLLADGSEATHECILVPVVNGEGEVEAVACAARDMTERKQLEKDLLREKTLADTIIESAPGGFFLLDDQSNLIRWNKTLSLETGLSDEQLQGAPILSVILKEDRPMAAAKFLSAFATGYARLEVRLPTHEKGIRHQLKTVRRFMLEGTPYLAGFSIDITERKLAEQAILREKVFSDALIESVPGAFYVVDQEGDFLRWNSALTRLTGLSDQALFGRPSLLTFHEEDRPLAAATLKDALERGYGQVEVRVLGRDLDIRPFILSLRSFAVGDALYLVGVGMDITDWLARLKALEQEAWTDPLTHTANRRHFLEIAKQEFARCRRYGHPLSVWMLDIDHFKAVNDTYGHHAGDVVLQSLVSTSRQALRDWDILGRVGGEEFAVVLPETASEQSLQVAERLRQAVATTESTLENGESAHITVSIGVATAHDEDTNLDTLLQRADQALYEAKRTGRDKVCLAKA